MDVGLFVRLNRSFAVLDELIGFSLKLKDLDLDIHIRLKVLVVSRIILRWLID